MSDKVIIPGVNDGTCDSGSCTDEDKKPNPSPAPTQNNGGVSHRNGKCNCGRTRCIPISTVEVVGDTLSFGTSEVFTPVNGDSYTVVVPCSLIPPMQALLQVVLLIDDVPYPVTDFTLGNWVYNDLIRCLNRDRCGNYVFRVVFGDNKPHFKIISQKLPRTLFEV